jgi:hypothetical protein
MEGQYKSEVLLLLLAAAVLSYQQSRQRDKAGRRPWMHPSPKGQLGNAGLVLEHFLPVSDPEN